MILPQKFYRNTSSAVNKAILKHDGVYFVEGSSEWKTTFSDIELLNCLSKKENIPPFEPVSRWPDEKDENQNCKSQHGMNIIEVIDFCSKQLSTGKSKDFCRGWLSCLGLDDKIIEFALSSINSDGKYLQFQVIKV